jgi:hypothetical protein
MRNAIEAAEQCGILHVPTVGADVGLEAAVSADRLLIFCDENAEVADPVSALAAARPRQSPISILIGPEGGFADEERLLLAKLPNVVPIALGRAFCARTRPRSRRLHWSRPFSATGRVQAKPVYPPGRPAKAARLRTRVGAQR